MNGEDKPVRGEDAAATAIAAADDEDEDEDVAAPKVVVCALSEGCTAAAMS